MKVQFSISLTALLLKQNLFFSELFFLVGSLTLQIRLLGARRSLKSMMIRNCMALSLSNMLLVLLSRVVRLF